jgi:tubulin delta
MLSNTIFVASGQCGNQVGYELINNLYSHLQDDRDNIDCFFRPSRANPSKAYARIVCLDTEPKVIQSCMSKSRANHSWLIDPKSVAYRHGGAGNNWALGYSMCSGDFLEIAINAIRREIEYCDYSPHIQSIHSMAGGTGSGLGAHLTEALQDHFDDILHSNIAILPYHFGEVVVQNYNAVLSLAKISSASDAVIILENEVAQDLCKRMKGIDRPSLEDINRIIAANLAPILLPKYDYYHSEGKPHKHDPMMTSFANDIIHLCRHPGYRILDVKTVPQTSEASVDFTFDSWPTLIKSLYRMQSIGTWSELGFSRMLSSSSLLSPSLPSATVTAAATTKLSFVASLGSVLTLRGKDSWNALSTQQLALQSTQRSIDDLLRLAQQPLSIQRQELSSNEVIPPIFFSEHLSKPMKLCYANIPCNRYEHSASILSNSQAILPVLERSVNKASELYHAQAYLHQYSTHQVEQASFQEAFEQVGQIIQNYRILTHSR